MIEHIILSLSSLCHSKYNTLVKIYYHCLTFFWGCFFFVVISRWDFWGNSNSKLCALKTTIIWHHFLYSLLNLCAFACCMRGCGYYLQKCLVIFLWLMEIMCGKGLNKCGTASQIRILYLWKIYSMYEFIFLSVLWSPPKDIIDFSPLTV